MKWRGWAERRSYNVGDGDWEWQRWPTSVERMGTVGAAEWGRETVGAVERAGLIVDMVAAALAPRRS
jgi:hypothetical protein